MKENSLELSSKPELTRRTFLRQFSSLVGYFVFYPSSGEAAKESVEPNDYWFDSQRPMFQKMHVLEAFDLEDRLEQAGGFTNLAPVRIGFVDYSGIIRIQDEFPPVPGWDTAKKVPIPEEGVYETSGPNNEPFYHATSAASIAISRVNNGVGIAGLCGRIPIKVQQVKFLRKENGFWTVPELLKDSLEYFTVPENYADVINITTTNYDSDALLDVVERLDKIGTVVVCGAGNFSSNKVDFPAAYPSVISVGAIRLSDDEKDPRSNFGKIDMAAYTDVYALTTNEGRRPILTTFSITSAATPLVSSLAAHLKFFRRDLLPKDVKEIMQITGTPVAGNFNWRLPNYAEALRFVVKAA